MDTIALQIGRFHGLSFFNKTKLPLTLLGTIVSQDEDGIIVMIAPTFLDMSVAEHFDAELSLLSNFIFTKTIYSSGRNMYLRIPPTINVACTFLPSSVVF